MKALNQIAKEFNLYQENDIPEIYKDEYLERKLRNGRTSIPEFFNTSQNFEAGLFYECKQDTNYDGKITYYIDHSYELVKKKDSDIVLMLKQDYGTKKYWFHPYYSLINKFSAIHYDIKNRAIKELKEPNRIGVFNDKKVNDWFDYSIKYMETLEGLLTEVNDKNKEIEESIKAFINSVPCKTSSYQNRTYVDTKLFEVVFEHYKEQKYLSTKITFKGKLEDITAIHSSLIQLA